MKLEINLTLPSCRVTDIYLPISLLLAIFFVTDISTGCGYISCGILVFRKTDGYINRFVKNVLISDNCACVTLINL